MLQASRRGHRSARWCLATAALLCALSVQVSCTFIRFEGGAGSTQAVDVDDPRDHKPEKPKTGGKLSLAVAEEPRHPDFEAFLLRVEAVEVLLNAGEAPLVQRFDLPEPKEVDVLADSQEGLTRVLESVSLDGADIQELRLVLDSAAPAWAIPRSGARENVATPCVVAAAMGSVESNPGSPSAAQPSPLSTASP